MDALTMGSVVRRSAEQYGDRTAIIYEGRRVTYAEYNERVNRAAHVLEGLGVTKGQHVGILGRNSQEYLEVCHGAAKTGVVFGTINWRLAPKEVSFIVTDADNEVLFIEAGFQALVEPVLDELAGITMVVYDGEATLPGALAYEQLMAAAATAEPDVEVDSSDDALIMYTSGTTGLPKGALLSHANIMWDAVGYLTYMTPAPTDCLLVGMPMNHVSGLHMLTNAFLVRGLPVVIQRTWEAEEACQLIEQYRVTMACILVTPLQMMLDLPNRGDYDLTSMRLILTAAAKYTRDFPIRVMYEIGIDHLVFIYGLTEAAPTVTVTELSGQMLYKENTLGFPAFYNDVRIVDENDIDVEVGEVGEVIVRGPNVFKGYYKRDEANAQTLKNGWLHTGDLARADEDGYLFFVDRRKDMIKSGGENVFSMEVEMGLLAAVPEIAEVGVIGVPDDKWGEAVTAVVALKPGAEVSAEKIVEDARLHLAGFKLPKRVIFLDELPKNHSGKIIKPRLRELANDLVAQEA